MSETEGSITGDDIRPESASNLQKCCWVCYGNESDDTLASWVQPCNCRGTSKWVSFPHKYNTICYLYKAVLCRDTKMIYMSYFIWCETDLKLHKYSCSNNNILHF